MIRGETPHFDYIASEAASGLQLAAIETGVPVSFGVLTVENVERRPKRRNPPPPFMTSTLQQEAARKLGFTARRTMQTAPGPLL